MENYRTGILTLVLICCFVLPAQAEVWTLSKTVRTALETSNRVAVSTYDADEAVLDASVAKKGWLPSLSVSGEARYISDIMEINLPFKTISFGGHDSYEMLFSVNQLVYDGGRLNALRDAGEDRAQMSRHRADAAALAVEYQAKAAFFSILMAQTAVEAAQQSLVEAQNHFHDVSALRSQGMMIENDVLRAKLRISSTEMELVSRRATVKRTQAAFRNVLGLAAEAPVVIEWEEPDRDQKKVANENRTGVQRPEFRAFESAVEVSEKTVRAAKAGQLPSIGMFGAFAYGKPGIDIPANEWMHYFSGGVRLNWNVWDWGKTKDTVEKARIGARKIERERDDFERDLARQIAEAFTNYEESESRHRLAGESAALAKKQLEQVRIAYREGMATETDYDTIHAMFTKAMHEKSVSKAALWLNRAYVDYVLGRRYAGGDHE